MVKRFQWILILFCLCSGLGFSQTSEHQRLGVEKETPWNLVLGEGSSMTSSGLGINPDFYWSNQVSAQFTLNNSWFCGAALPIAANETITMEDTNFRVGIGDPVLTLGWTGRLTDFRLTAGERCSFPLGLWDLEEAEAAEEKLITGSGRFYPGLIVSLSTIIDPIVLKGQLSWDVGLPWTERFESLWYPGIIGLSTNISEVLNDKIGYRIGVDQQLVLPPREEAAAVPSDMSYSATMEFEVYLSLEDLRIQAGVQKSLTNVLSPGSLTLSCSYSFDDEVGGV